MHCCNAPAPSSPFFSTRCCRTSRGLEESSVVSPALCVDYRLTCLPAFIYCYCPYCCQGLLEELWGPLCQFVSDAMNREREGVPTTLLTVVISFAEQRGFLFWIYQWFVNNSQALYCQLLWVFSNAAQMDFYSVWK